jgi:hypothetical protein
VRFLADGFVNVDRSAALDLNKYGTSMDEISRCGGMPAVFSWRGLVQRFGEHGTGNY